MEDRLNKSSCLSTSTCSFDNVYQPIPISSSLKFIAISAFYTTFTTLASNIPLTSDSNGNYDLSSTNLTQIYATIKNVCDQSWLNLTNPEVRYRPCRFYISIEFVLCVFFSSCI